MPNKTGTDRVGAYDCQQRPNDEVEEVEDEDVSDDDEDVVAVEKGPRRYDRKRKQGI